MKYCEIIINHHADEESITLLTAQLLDLGYDSFLEEPDTLHAYIPMEQFAEDALKTLLDATSLVSGFSKEEMPEQNWNAVWESNYTPVRFGNFCYIRAPFHPEVKDVRFDLIIEPKMSFGTAHHETTSLMIEWLQEVDVKGKHVLDMGCGTGVLAILAEKLGAKDVLAIDNDEWAYVNSMENIERNKCEHTSVLLGDADALKGKTFDVIIANINRNILLADISAYATCLTEGATLLLSGFYTEDISAILEVCVANHLDNHQVKEKNRWVALKLTKIS